MSKKGYTGTMSNFLIFDGHAILHRAYHALPPLTNKKGQLTNAVYGFLLVLFKVLKEYEPKHIAVCFDTDAKTFRDELYQEYKANRVETDQELKDQVPMIQDVLKTFGITVVEKEGFEADDCIGTLVRRGYEDLPDAKLIIVTGDADTLQLVNERIAVYMLRKGMSDTVLMHAGEVKEKYGVSAEELIEWKALRGDASDNIPGVRGIGEKTATELIQKFHSIERLYQSLDSIESVTLRAKLEAGKSDAQLSRTLATIKRDVPLDLEFATFEWKGFDEGAVTEKLLEYGFRSLVARIPSMKKQGQFFFKQKDKITENAKTLKRKSTSVIPAKAGIQKQKLTKKDLNSFGVSVGFLDPKSKLGMTMILDQKDYSTLKQEWLKFGLIVRVYQDKVETVLTLCANQKLFVLRNKDVETHKLFLRETLSSPEINKIGHDLKTDYKALKSLGLTLHPLWFDCKIAGYVLDAGTRKYDLSDLIETYASDVETRDLVSLPEVGSRTWSNDRMQENLFVYRLFQILDKELSRRRNDHLFHTFDMPLVSVLADMELEGIRLDVGFLKVFGKELAKKLGLLTKQITKLAGGEFNINSPKQLKEILFEKLGISAAGLGRTKTGISTGAEELEKIRNEHPIVSKILEYRELFKLKSTYVDTLPTMVDENSRVHTTFNQTIAATGRLSSQDPNLQNIPIRTTEGSRMRKAFVSRKGWKLLSVDYSQFELRVVASLSRDPELTKAFKSGADIHAATAAKVFGVQLAKVTPEQRRNAKTINFGIIYGLGAKGLAQNTGMSVFEAKEFIRKYFEIHKGLKTFFDKVLNDGREKGYSETLFGRRRYLPDLNSPVHMLRAAAERMAINHPIQGSQADLLKLAMIHVHQALNKAGLLDDVKMLLQIHDELVFEIRDKAVSKARTIIEHELTHVYKLCVPIEVEVGVGKNWAECHK